MPAQDFEVHLESAEASKTRQSLKNKSAATAQSKVSQRERVKAKKQKKL